MIRRETRLLLRDELVGFARGKVMLVLWVILPALALLGFLLLPREFGGVDEHIPLTHMMGLLISSLAGTVAAIMISVEIISERSRKVYELFIIRPISRDSILWSKFTAVSLCVTVACLVSLLLGLVVDLTRGVELPDGMLTETLKSFGSVIGVVVISTSIGVFFAVICDSVLVAVILILYLGQNLAILPMLPAYLGLGDGWYVLLMLTTAAATVATMLFSGWLFRRKEF